jgi:hypothetical protein
VNRLRFKTRKKNIHDPNKLDTVHHSRPFSSLCIFPCPFSPQFRVALHAASPRPAVAKDMRLSYDSPKYLSRCLVWTYEIKERRNGKHEYFIPKQKTTDEKKKMNSNSPSNHPNSRRPPSPPSPRTSAWSSTASSRPPRSINCMQCWKFCNVSGCWCCGGAFDDADGKAPALDRVLLELFVAPAAVLPTMLLNRALRPRDICDCNDKRRSSRSRRSFCSATAMRAACCCCCRCG